MTLDEIHNGEKMEPEESTSSIYTGSPLEGWGHLPIFKIFDSELFLSKRNAGTKVEQRLKERPSSEQADLGPIP